MKVYADRKGNTGGYVALAAVLCVVAVCMAGSAYALSATYTDSFMGVPTEVHSVKIEVNDPFNPMGKNLSVEEHKDFNGEVGYTSTVDVSATGLAYDEVDNTVTVQLGTVDIKKTDVGETWFYKLSITEVTTDHPETFSKVVLSVAANGVMTAVCTLPSDYENVVSNIGALSYTLTATKIDGASEDEYVCNFIYHTSYIDGPNDMGDVKVFYAYSNDVDSIDWSVSDCSEHTDYEFEGNRLTINSRVTGTHTITANFTYDDGSHGSCSKTIDLSQSATAIVVPVPAPSDNGDVGIDEEP